MTAVRALRFDATVVTFDDRDHPEGLVLASTAPLTLAPTFSAYLRHPDGTYFWGPSTATWVRDGHPWALLRLRAVDPDDHARKTGPRRGGVDAELTITDDRDAGLHTLDPARVAVRPHRATTTATTPHDPERRMQVMIDDGADESTPSRVTVLDGAGVLSSGSWLLADPLLATRVRDDAAPVISDVRAVEPTARRGIRTRLGGDTLVFAPAPDAQGEPTPDR